jgi:hypothetical protein
MAGRDQRCHGAPDPLVSEAMSCCNAAVYARLRRGLGEAFGSVVGREVAFGQKVKFSARDDLRLI